MPLPFVIHWMICSPLPLPFSNGPSPLGLSAPTPAQPLASWASDSASLGAANECSSEEELSTRE